MKGGRKYVNGAMKFKKPRISLQEMLENVLNLEREIDIYMKEFPGYFEDGDSKDLSPSEVDSSGASTKEQTHEDPAINKRKVVSEGNSEVKRRAVKESTEQKVAVPVKNVAPENTETAKTDAIISDDVKSQPSLTENVKKDEVAVMSDSSNVNAMKLDKVQSRFENTRRYSSDKAATEAANKQRDADLTSIARHVTYIQNYINENYWRDICFIKNRDKKFGLFFIHFPGNQLISVSLTQAQINVVNQNMKKFESILQMKGGDFEFYQNLIKWDQTLGSSHTSALPNELYWNNTTYVRVGNTSKFRIRDLAREKFETYRVVCSSFARTGECSNMGCKFLHDPKTISFCKKYYFTGVCLKRSCMMNHDLKYNEYTTPSCCLNLKNSCKYKKGFSEDSTNSSNHCRFMHDTETNPEFPNCRQFAHIGFCPRGRMCPFTHVWMCPETASQVNCLLHNCNLSHKLPSTKGRHHKDYSQLKSQTYRLPYLSNEIPNLKLQEDYETYYTFNRDRRELKRHMHQSSKSQKSRDNLHRDNPHRDEKQLAGIPLERRIGTNPHMKSSRSHNH